MNQSTKIIHIFSFLIASYPLHATQLVSQSAELQKNNLSDSSSSKRILLLINGYTRTYQLFSQALSIIRHFFGDDILQYQGQDIREDLSGKDLRSFNFQFSCFNGTKLG